MSRKPLLDPNRFYTFNNYFDLNADPFDLVAEFGYFLTRSPLQLPQFSAPLEQINFLKERIDNILPYVDLTNETARREILSLLLCQNWYELPMPVSVLSTRFKLPLNCKAVWTTTLEPKRIYS